MVMMIRMMIMVMMIRMMMMRMMMMRMMMMRMKMMRMMRMMRMTMMMITMNMMTMRLPGDECEECRDEEDGVGCRECDQKLHKKDCIKILMIGKISMTIVKIFIFASKFSIWHQNLPGKIFMKTVEVEVQSKCVSRSL